MVQGWGQAQAEKIHSWELVSISGALEKFEHTLSAELREAATYYIPRIGIFDTPRLVDGAEHHIDTELRAHMNEMAIKDFHDAGRCLAFDLPTASGFHAARSVEGVLAAYYKTFAGESAPPPNNGTMGDYLKALEEMTTSVAGNLPEQKTLRTLREIAKLDRNPVMHPRETLDRQEAAIFFNLATSAIMAMAREINALGSAAQEKLPLSAPTGALYLSGIPFSALGGLAGPPVQALMTKRIGADEQGRLQGAMMRTPHHARRRPPGRAVRHPPRVWRMHVLPRRLHCLVEEPGAE